MSIRWTITLGVLLLGAARLPAQEIGAYEESLVKALKNLDAIVSELEKVKDADSAQAAKEPLAKLAKEHSKLKAEAEKLPPPEKKEKDKLTKDYQPKFDKTLKKLLVERLRVESVPGGLAALQELQPVLEKKKK